jgi:hypothetical protein
MILDADGKPVRRKLGFAGGYVRDEQELGVQAGTNAPRPATYLWRQYSESGTYREPTMHDGTDV